MGNKPPKPLPPPKPVPPPDPCPGTRRYADDLKSSNNRLREHIVDLNNAVTSKKNTMNQLKTANDALIKKRDSMYTSVQLDDAKRKAMKPLEETIAKNNNVLSNFNSTNHSM